MSRGKHRAKTLNVSLLAVLCLIVTPQLGNAQARIPLSYRAVYANDQFNKTDRYYTAGFHQSIGTERFRVGLTYALYSPTEIDDAEMRHDDRPYAATAILSVQRHFRGRDTLDKWIVEGAVGLIGPQVGGEAVQSKVHSLVGVAKPGGWRYQIAEAALLGVQVNYVRTVVQRRYFQANAGAELRLGTPFTRLGVDACASVGPRALRLEVATQVFSPLYDATIQGGSTRRESPLYYERSALAPLVGRLEIKIAARRGRWSGFCAQTLLSRELKAGTGHAYIVCGGEIRW